MAYISIGGLRDAGTAPDQPAYDIPPEYFNHVEGVEFTAEGVRNAVKEVELFAPVSINPLDIVKVKLANDDEAFVYLGLYEAYVVRGGVHTNITRVAGDGGNYAADEPTGWQEAILHGVPIFNNGNDLPQQYDPQNPESPLTNLANWPVDLTTQVIRPYKNFLIALQVNVGNGVYDRQVMIWSSPADPGTVPPSWDYTDPAEQAGLYTFSETDDKVIDGLALGDEFIVYKERSIYAVRFIGGTFVMSIKRRPGDVGLLTAEAVCDTPRGHCFVGQDDVYLYRGNSYPESISNGRVRRELFTNITQGQKSKIFVKHDATRKAVWIFYPSNNSLWCNKAAIWRYENNTWSFRDVPQVSGATFGDVTLVVQKTWDDLRNAWGGGYTISWGTETLVWGTIGATWAVDDDLSPWDSDTTTWDFERTWDQLRTDEIWDVQESTPVVENLIMCSYIVSEPTFDSDTNTSEADGVEWTGLSNYPPFWLVPNEGKRFRGKLRKEGIALVGRNHRGEAEVDRTVQKILREFYPEMDYGQIEIRFGSQQHPREVIEWGDWLDFDASVEVKLDPLVNGRYLAFEIQGASDLDDEWLLSGYGMEIEKGGRY